MTTAITQHPAPLRKPARTAQLTGEVVYLYAFDIAYEMNRLPVRELLGQPVAQFVVDASKRAPRQLFFYRPQMVRLPPLERLGPRGPIRLERSVKLLPVGAISITVRVPFAVQSLDELVSFHDLRFSDGSYLYDQVRALADEVRSELMPYLIRPLERVGDEEAYTVFCMNGPLQGTDGSDLGSAQWLIDNRRDIAALLTEESDPRHLSEQEVEESTAKSFGYYDRDLVVIDWDAALVIDEPRYFDEVLYIMELANFQLAELEAYDRILDGAVDRSYRDLSSAGGWRRQNSAGVQKQLREIRVDLARLSDELSNITKFFGDWHLARIYKGLSDRFHLGDWHHTIDQKLQTLDGLYQILRTDQTNRTMLLLEVTIVLLFVIDLVVLILGLK